MVLIAIPKGTDPLTNKRHNLNSALSFYPFFNRKWSVSQAHPPHCPRPKSHSHYGESNPSWWRDWGSQSGRPGRSHGAGPRVPQAGTLGPSEWHCDDHEGSHGTATAGPVSCRGQAGEGSSSRHTCLTTEPQPSVTWSLASLGSSPLPPPWLPHLVKAPLFTPLT